MVMQAVAGLLKWILCGRLAKEFLWKGQVAEDRRIFSEA
jgi:hypothetical protein